MAGRLLVLVPVTASVGMMSSMVLVGMSSPSSSSEESASVGDAVGIVRKAFEPERNTESGLVIV
jgi:hypothetical protein